MKVLQSLLSVVVAVFGVQAVASAAPPDSANVVLGIQVGVPLEAQFDACPMEGDRPTRLDGKHCWSKSPYGRVVLHSKQLFAEIGWVEFRSIRELGGAVVEVEAEFFPRDAQRVERYLRQSLGTPTESEEYERDNRLTGSSTYMSHSWRGAGATIHFQELGPRGKGLVRGFSNRWADEEQKRQQSSPSRQ
jgi:hypothetical protein